MDDCEQLRHLLQFELDVYQKHKKETFLRFILSAMGIESIYDAIKSSKLNWGLIWDALVLLDYALIIKMIYVGLKAAGLQGVAQEFGKRIGPWAIGFMILQIGWSYYSYSQEENENKRAFRESVKRLYNASNCHRKDEILRELNIKKP